MTELALFLHVLGAMILVGGLVTADSAQLLGWTRQTPVAAAAFSRIGFRALLLAALPGWILMRVGAEWIYAEAGWDEVDPSPGWLDMGAAIADLGGPILLVALVLAGLGARRVRKSGESASTLVRIATLLSLFLLAAYVVAVWAMSAKPD
jgi:uncharacterized membrane protein